jgi:hypothetical protein
MPKSAGMGDNLYVGGYDLSGDVGSLEAISCHVAVQDVTGINKSARERIALIRDGQIDFTSFFNDATTAGAEGAHEVLSAVPSAAILTYFRGTAVGNAAASMNALRTDYNGQRNADGSITFKTTGLSYTTGIEWMRQLTAGKVTHASATNGTALDQTAVSTAFGGAAVWHVFTLGSGTVDGEIQDSADNVSFALVGGLSFAATAVRTAERVQTTTLTDTIRRYVRFSSTGTFTNAALAVAFIRYLTTQAF